MSTSDHRPVRQEIQLNIKINRQEQWRLHPLIHTLPPPVTSAPDVEKKKSGASDSAEFLGK